MPDAAPSGPDTAAAIARVRRHSALPEDPGDTIVERDLRAALARG